MKPPSAKTRHWITSTEASVSNAAHGPSIAESRIPPTRWPLEPVPGIEKFIIWAAKTKAPITPISGTMCSSRASGSRRSFRGCLTFQIAVPSRTSDTAPVTANTGGETSASDMCIVCCFSGFQIAPSGPCRTGRTVIPFSRPAAAPPDASCSPDTSSNGRASPRRRT